MTRSASLFIRNIAIVVVSVTLLSACETTPYGTTSQRAVPGTPASAAEYAREGNHTAAARVYRKLAKKSTGIQRDAYLLEAAQQWFEQKNYAEAQKDLDKIMSMLDAQTQVRKILLESRILLELEQPALALELINTLDPQGSDNIARPYFALKGRAYFEMGLLSEGTREFIRREEFLRSPEEIQANRERLWLELNDKIVQGYRKDNILPQSSVNNYLSGERLSIDALITGWVTLAQAVANVPSVRLQKQVINRWAKSNPMHPAIAVAMNNLYAPAYPYGGEMITALAPIQRVGVLLPLSGQGRASRAGQVIREGIEAANRRRSLPLDISFHDTSLGVMNAYQAAMAFEVDALIGPLHKDNILALFGGLGDTPALVLNRIDDYLGVKGLLQFGLAPEDEAVIAAQFALSEGYTQAVTLTPDNEWGERVAEHFILAFAAGGGLVQEQASYSTRDRDHTRAITAMLNIDESVQRYRRLINLIGPDLDGSDIEYEKRRRQDVDFIFLAAKPEHGRAIRPQLNFHQALRIPVFATSDIYEADPVRNKNKDLNGIQLPLSEWVIDPVARDALLAIEFNSDQHSPANSQLLQLFSLGFDSLNYLAHLTIDPQLAFSGLSGELSIDDYGVVHRNLPLAAINRGQIEKIQDRQVDPDFVFDEFFSTEPDFYDPSLNDPYAREPGFNAPGQQR